MHKNYRRKNPRPCTHTYWSLMRKDKQHVLNQRTRSRRQRDRNLLRKTIYEEDAWEEIRTIELPVDWWAID